MTQRTEGEPTYSSLRANSKQGENLVTEEQLLKLLKVQSNLCASDFTKIFGIEGQRLFHLFSRNQWNLLHFAFNVVNGENRIKLLELINTKIQDEN